MEKIPEDIIILQRQKCNGQNVLSFWTIFYPLKLSNNPKNQNPKKNEKKKLEIMSFYICVQKRMTR